MMKIMVKQRFYYCAWPLVSHIKKMLFDKLTVKPIYPVRSTISNGASSESASPDKSGDCLALASIFRQEDAGVYPP